jgi:hypothetical protein
MMVDPSGYIGFWAKTAISIGVGLAIGAAIALTIGTGGAAAPLVALAAGALEGAVTQVICNAIDGNDLGAGVLEEAAIGAASAAVGFGIGKVFSKVSKGVDKAKIFKHGELFESSITTKSGTKIQAIEEVNINKKALTLDNLAIYSDIGDIPNKVGHREMKQWINHVSDLARNEGFDTLKIGGVGALNSTSANPGHIIDFTVRLR